MARKEMTGDHPHLHSQGMFESGAAIVAVLTLIEELPFSNNHGGDDGSDEGGWAHSDDDGLSPGGHRDHRGGRGLAAGGEDDDDAGSCDCSAGRAL